MQTTFTKLPSCIPANNTASPISIDIASVVRTTAVKVPSWFPVSGALRVARLKGVQYLLVLDRQSVVGSVSVATLLAAPGHDLLARWMRRCEVSVSPETSREEACRLMTLHGVECLPVASGAILLGLVGREDLFELRLREAAE